MKTSNGLFSEPFLKKIFIGAYVQDFHYDAGLVRQFSGKRGNRKHYVKRCVYLRERLHEFRKRSRIPFGWSSTTHCAGL
jgi:hypothetical protein